MRRLTRTQGWILVDGLAVAFVVALLDLIGLNVLVLTSTPDTTVTVKSVTLNIAEGNDSFGWGWLGNSTRTLGVNEGFPIQVVSAGTFALAFLLPIEDRYNHTAVSISAAPPFQVTRTTPSLPAQVTVGDDDWQLTVVIEVPAVSHSQSYSVTLDLVMR